MTEEIYLHVDKQDIDFINRVMEGYEHLGIVSTIDGQHGIIVIRTTPDFYGDVVAILHNLKQRIEILPSCP